MNRVAYYLNKIEYYKNSPKKRKKYEAILENVRNQKSVACPICGGINFDNIVYGLVLDREPKKIYGGCCCYDEDLSPDYFCVDCKFNFK